MAKKETSGNYRLTLVDDISHEFLGSIRFTRAKALAAVISFIVVFLAIIYCLIAFTPIRVSIPGYPDSYSKKKAIENAIKIDSLESIILRWELYNENLTHVLTGEQTVSLDSIVKLNSTKYLKDLSTDEMHQQDSILKDKMKAR